MMPETGRIAHVAASLEREGYVAVQDFLDAADVQVLADECRAFDRDALLAAAGVGRGAGHRVDAALRGDRTRWFDAARPSPAQRRYWTAMDALRQALNRALLLGLDALEAHYALYPPGARYARHRDRFRDDDARVLSSVLYLNEDWTQADGGALRLYRPCSDPRVGRAEDSVDVLPAGGTLVLFLSDELEHEVLPARRERLSIAGWFRRR